MKVLVLFRGWLLSHKSMVQNPVKSTFFKTHSLKIFNLAQQNLTKLLCRNCANNIKEYVGYVDIYAFFKMFHMK